MNTKRWMTLAAVGLCGLIPLQGKDGTSRRSPVAPEPDAYVFAQNARLGRGVNAFAYDPGWQDPGRRRMQASHFRKIKDAGFSNVRLSLHPFERMGAADDGYLLDKNWVAVADWALERALAEKLMVILDCHEYHAMAEDPEGQKPKWLAFWRQMAQHWAGAPETALFELLNEPNHGLTPEMWNAYLVDALAIVRGSNPRRTVIIGPGEWNSIPRLGELVLPETDRNIIVTVHYYEPHLFTHQGAEFEGRAGDVGYAWNGNDSERLAIERDFRTAQEWAKRHGRPIYLGEFGAYDQADMGSRARWTSFVARQAESLGWSWAYWQFDSDFIVYDIDADRWVEPLRDALIPPSR